MPSKNIILRLFLLAAVVVGLRPAARVVAVPGASGPAAVPAEVAPYDLIAAMNTLRVSNGYPALVEDPIINAVAQGTAEIMAANLMSWHIGNVRGRLASAGYGGGGTVFATENFAMGYTMTIDEIMVAWSDPDHMRPAVTAAYCNIGAGVATASNGMVYYILQAAYVASSACGEYNSPGTGTGSGSSGSGIVWGPIIPVEVADPDTDGRVYHIVKSGQSLWSIAIAYHITINDLEKWNNISRNNPLPVNTKLFIPDKNTAGFATPTPVGMFDLATPDADGRILHKVAPYQALITIAEAYKVSVDTLLKLNNYKADWPLQIGQTLVINPGNVTPSPTPRPLTPVEMLTPAADGNYYHVVHSGETLSWIAGLYKIAVNDLMVWNGLVSADIRPDQKLILQVTPPATVTFTPGPPTATPTATNTFRPPTATVTATLAPPPTPTPEPAIRAAWLAASWPYAAVTLAAAGLLFLGLVSRKKPPE